MLREGAATLKGCNWECGSFPVVASPWLPEQLPLAKAGRILERVMEGLSCKKVK